MPGDCYRINLDGSVDELYGDIEVTNGIGFSPDGRTLYHVDSTSKGVWAHDVAADGSVSNRRHVGRAAFERGIPDGMCVDADGQPVGRPRRWSPGGQAVARPARRSARSRCRPRRVTSVAFGGPDWSRLYIVTADNLDDASKGGSIFVTSPGVQGLPTPLAAV